MAKFHFKISISLLIVLATPMLCFSFEPPRTPIVKALEQGSHAFIGRLISVEYVNEEKGIERAEGTFEILLPIYGVAPKKGEKTKIIYYTTYEVDPCLDFEKVPVGTAFVFIFNGKQNLAPETYTLSYCWPKIDLSYKITGTQWNLESKEGILDVSLISGWWDGKIPVKKLQLYMRREKNE